MSTEEKDEILGRVIRQSKEAEREVASLEAKLTAFAQAYAELASKVAQFARTGVEPPDGGIALRVRALPASDEVLSTARDMEEARLRLADLKRQLDVLAP